MIIDFNEDEGATPLSPEEKEGLILTHITTRGELNRWEQDNIAEGEAWAFSRKQKDILSENFTKKLHYRTFGDVWRWAGEFRRSDRNIGIPWQAIPVQLRELIDDVNFWMTSATYSSDEIAARFHHRLVFIHPFPNGNGRHARTLTDLLLVQILSCERFSWGRGNLLNQGDCRQMYIEALRAADRHEYELLLKFVRS